MPATAVSSELLVSLYLGDRYSLGYYHPALAFEICRREVPSTFERLRSYMFGASTPIESISPDAYEILHEGYQLWQCLKRPILKTAARS